MQDHKMYRLFEVMNKSNIEYCCYKGDYNLRKSFYSDSDFDILAHKEDRNKITNIFEKFCIKQFESPYVNNYPMVENWLCYDEYTGNIYHIHIHFWLITGTEHVREYVLDFDNILIKNSHINHEYRAKCPDVNISFILLIIRMAIKHGRALTKNSKTDNHSINHKFLEQYLYLIEKIDSNTVRDYAEELFSEQMTSLIMELLDTKDLNIYVLGRIYSQIGREKKIRVRMNHCLVCLKYTFVEIVKVLDRWTRLCSFNFITKKVSKTNKGVFIAFVGIDGSGKTSLSQDIYDWLNVKLEVRKLYLGAGDGTNKKIHRLKRLVNKLEKIKIFGRDYSDYARAYVNYKIIKKNYKTIKNAGKYCNKGGCSISDRYPQNELLGLNDGRKVEPISIKYKYSLFLKWLCLLEKKYAKKICEIHPDIMFRLNISLESCINRKEEHALIRESLEEKYAEFYNLKYPGINIIDINAEQPYVNELHEIKGIIWNWL